MASYVVDIQGFKSLSNQFLIKELCIVGVENNNLHYCLVAPPTRYNCISPQLRRRVNYITKNIHGLNWNLGFMSEKSAINILRNAVKNANKVYIKGSERVSFLRFLLDYSVPVVDLDTFNFGTTNESKYPVCDPKLKHHCELRCALRKALMYKDSINSGGNNLIGRSK